MKTVNMPVIAELQHITKTFYHIQYPASSIQHPASRPQHPVLNDLSLIVRRNESIAIVGPSGSGKTTLLNILGTLDKPTSGEVILEGQPVLKMDDDQLAELRNSRIGFVFQLHYLLPQFTLIENVLLPVLPTRDKARQSAAHERAWNLINKVGLTLQAHQRPAELSVGECQRAAVVRALINQPILLLADEPTGSLDAENATMLASLLNDLKLETELSMVVVTHSMDLAEKMDTIYRLQSGNLAVFDK